MENRSGLAVDVEATKARDNAEREVTTRMVKRTVQAGCTLGADKDTAPRISCGRCVEPKSRLESRLRNTIRLSMDGPSSIPVICSASKSASWSRKFWMGEYPRRSAQDPVYWLGRGDGANRLHICLLQPEPNGNAIRLVIVCGGGRNPPSGRRTAACTTERGQKTG